MSNQLIFKYSCWQCLKAKEDPQEQYNCPNYQQHWQEAENISIFN